MTELEKLIEKEFEKRNYVLATRKIYKFKLFELFEFYDQFKPKDITFIQIDSFLFKKKREESPSSVENSYWSFKMFYNEVLGKDYPFYKIRLPEKESTLPELLTQNEIRLFLSNIKNLKHKTIFTILYSTGLKIDELKALVVKDILSDKSQLRIRKIKSGKIRYAHLSDKLLKLLREYYKKYKPKKYLIEGQKPNSQYSDSSMRAILEKTMKICEIDKGFTLSGFKNCYVKHMVEQGNSLPAILKEMQVTHPDMVDFYYKLCGKEERINTSPIDKLGVILDLNSFNTIELEAILDKIQNLDERDYLRESISCFKVGALRAGVIFIWSATVRNLHNKCVLKGFKEINNALHKINPSQKPLKKLEDFETIKDKTVIDIANKIGILSKHEKSELEKHLDLRNYCGHPSEYYPEIAKIKAYLEDLINIVLIK